MNAASQPVQPAGARGFLIGLSLALATLVFAAFQPALDNDFVGYDDPDYVTSNVTVQRGFNWDGVKWAFSATEAANWHPLTWLSHMLDVQCYGLNPAGHHLTSVLLHTLSSVLLFLMLRSLTGATWRSLIVAALFGLHPLRVESVAWVAERKDALSTVFWFLTILVYAHYVRTISKAKRIGAERFDASPHPDPLPQEREQPAGASGTGTGIRPSQAHIFTSLGEGFPLSPGERAGVRANAPHTEAVPQHQEYRAGQKRRAIALYAVALLCFAGGLMAKPMLVTLPFVLLLLDFWPLKRLEQKTFSALVLEKLPFFALSIASSILTFVVQRSAGAVNEYMSLGYRLSNVVVSFARYLGKTFWPADLAFFYPHPTQWPMAFVTGAVLLLAAISLLAFQLRKRQPSLLIGWCWFLGTLVPVIGLVQVGQQSIADRYSYIPSVGILIALVWGVQALAADRKRLAQGLAVVGVVAALAGLTLTRQQTRVWKNTESLCRHAIAVIPNNYLAHDMLGATLEKQGKQAEALREHLRALEIKPNHADAHNNLAVALQHQGQLAEAVKHYQLALQYRPRYAEAHFNLAVALETAGQFDNAATEYSRAIAQRRHYADAHYNLGLLQGRLGRLDQAVAQFQETLRINPQLADAHNNLGVTLDRLGRLDEAIAHYRHAIALRPDYARAYFNLGVALGKAGQLAAAASAFETALRLNPDYTEARTNLESTRAAMNSAANPKP